MFVNNPILYMQTRKIKKKKNFFEKKKKINLVYVEWWPPKCASWVGDGKPNR